MQGWPLNRASPPTIAGIVGIRAVAVQLVEIGEHSGDVVERVGPLRVARDLRDLPRGQLAVDLLRQLLALLVQPGDLVGDVDRGIFVHVAQLVDLRLSSAIGCSKSRKVCFMRGRRRAKRPSMITNACAAQTVAVARSTGSSAACTQGREHLVCDNGSKHDHSARDGGCARMLREQNPHPDGPRMGSSKARNPTSLADRCRAAAVISRQPVPS